MDQLNTIGAVLIAVRFQKIVILSQFTTNPLNILIIICFAPLGEDMHILRQNIPRPMSLIAVANQTLECEDNPCSILNGGCEDICQMNSGGHVTCSCHPGRFLIKPGGKRCAYTKKKCQNDAEFQCSQSLDNDPICIPYR